MKQMSEDKRELSQQHSENERPLQAHRNNNDTEKGFRRYGERSQEDLEINGKLIIEVWRQNRLRDLIYEAEDVEEQ